MAMTKDYFFYKQNFFFFFQKISKILEYGKKANILLRKP